MLWHIIGTPHRLLGSMHQIPDGAAMPEWVEASYEGIERFVFESDHLKYPEKQFGLDPTKAHLRSYGASEIYERAKKLLAGIGYNEPIDTFRPWRAARVVENRFVEHYGYLGTNGADERLRRLAEEKKLMVEFFESNSRSSELLEESCKNFQGGLAYFRLVVAATKSGAGQSRLKRMLQAWLSSDFKDTIAIQREEMAEASYMVTPHLQRNREWVPVAKKMITENTPTLFVVGSMHTVGKGSFIELMENNGFRFKFIA
jgi:uncharacterized protein YbaP (TraB family)